jgi:hypothetical protein
VWISRNQCYENPYIVTGNIKLTGLEEASKDKCTDRIIETRKGQDVE